MFTSGLHLYEDVVIMHLCTPTREGRGVVGAGGWQRPSAGRKLLVEVRSHYKEHCQGFWNTEPSFCV